MRIAQVAPLFESVPPPGYGGTERVVHWLTEELSRRGHDVVLYASGNSRTSATLVAMCGRNLRAAGEAVDPPLVGPSASRRAPNSSLGSASLLDADALHASALQAAVSADPPFDVIHAHLDWLGVALSARSPVPIVTTMHGRLDVLEIQSVGAACPRAPLVSISFAQRRPLASARWVANIPHGLPMRKVPFIARPDDYLAFVGRISPEKRPDMAIRVARAVGLPLRIAAKVNGNRADEVYWREVVGPLLEEGEGVEFVGEISDEQKPEFMGRARALLFPVGWPEPFGLVAIEAMSFGTPVITTPMGALPEIVDDGRTGFLVDGLSSMAAAVRAVDSIDRAECRAAVEARFHVDRMVDDYERLYRGLAARKSAFMPARPGEGGVV